MYPWISLLFTHHITVLLLLHWVIPVINMYAVHSTVVCGEVWGYVQNEYHAYGIFILPGYLSNITCVHPYMELLQTSHP